MPPHAPPHRPATQESRGSQKRRPVRGRERVRMTVHRAQTRERSAYEQKAALSASARPAAILMSPWTGHAALVIYSQGTSLVGAALRTGRARTQARVRQVTDKAIGCVYRRLDILEEPGTTFRALGSVAIGNVIVQTQTLKYVKLFGCQARRRRQALTNIYAPCEEARLDALAGGGHARPKPHRDCCVGRRVEQQPPNETL